MVLLSFCWLCSFVVWIVLGYVCGVWWDRGFTIGCCSVVLCWVLLILVRLVVCYLY